METRLEQKQTNGICADCEEAMRGNEHLRALLDGDCQGPEWPIMFRNNCIELSNQRKKASQLILPMLQVRCAFTMIHRYSEAGFSVKDMCNIFNHIPSGLANVLEEGLRALQVVAPRVMPVPIQKKVTNTQSVIQFHEMKLLDNIRDFGCVRLEWNNEGERESVYFNDVFALLAGAHKEELLSRAALCELPLPMTEFDLICTILDDVLRCGSPTITRYVRWRVGFVNGGQGQAAFLKWTRNKSISPSEGIENALHSFSLVTPEEYDWALRTTPELCRPLTWELGDFRSASSCLNDFQNEWHEMRISTLQSSEHGRHLLSRFTELVRSKFAPFVTAAKLIQMNRSDPSLLPASAEVCGGAYLSQISDVPSQPHGDFCYAGAGAGDQGMVQVVQTSGLCQGDGSFQFVPYACGQEALQSRCSCHAPATSRCSLGEGVLHHIPQHPHDLEGSASHLSSNVREGEWLSQGSIHVKGSAKNERDEPEMQGSRRDPLSFSGFAENDSEANLFLNPPVVSHVVKSSELRIDRCYQDPQSESGQLMGLEDPLEAILPRLD